MSDRADLLVLGGSGPIGLSVTRVARSAGMSVVSASRRGPVRFDAGDRAAVESIFAQVAPRTLVYLVNAPASSPERAVADLEAALRIGVRHGVDRVLFASSAAVYGDGGVQPYAEGAALAGASDYALSKIRSEQALARLATETSVLSLRVFNVFGPGCDTGLINRLAGRSRPPLVLTARFVRDYVHVDDVARAFVQAAARPELTGVVNIARGVAVDNLQLAEAAGPDAFVAQDAGTVCSYSVADVTTARDALPWDDLADPIDLLRTQRR